MKKSATLIIIFLVTIPLFSQNTERYIIKTKQELNESRLNNILGLKNGDNIELLFKELNLYLLKSNHINSKYINRIRSNNIIDFIVKDSKLEYRNTPNDPNYIKQYAPSQIRADELWDYNTGGLSGKGDTIVIAVLDKGLETTHVDLVGNIWRNNEEIPGDSIDNDNNGYIDDYFGVDLKNKTDIHNIDYHGTAVAGIIGAKGNNGIGISGINWNIKILPITSVNYISDVIEGYNYVYKLRKKFNDSDGISGAFIVATNLSAGYNNVFPKDSPEYMQWCNIYDLLGEQGVLNTTSPSNDPVNVEEKGDMPTLCSSDYLIPVTSTDKNDNFDTYRSFGKKSIDLAAPGKDIYTLYSNNGYKKKFSGNSAAAPQVAGAIGLLYTMPCPGFYKRAIANPAEFSLIIKQHILDYSDKHPDLTNKTVSGGRLDVYNTYIHLAETLCPDFTTGTFDLKPIYPNPATSNIFIEYSNEDFDPHTIIIYNSIGQKVFTKTFRPKLFGKKIETIDIRKFSSGVYFVKLVAGKNNITKSFCKI